MALKLLKDHVKSDVSTGLYLVITEADGNCLPRSISLLVFGDQEHHDEIRCRIVHEMVLNESLYLEGHGMLGEGECPEQLMKMVATGVALTFEKLRIANAQHGKNCIISTDLPKICPGHDRAGLQTAHRPF